MPGAGVADAKPLQPRGTRAAMVVDSSSDEGGDDDAGDISAAPVHGSTRSSSQRSAQRRVAAAVAAGNGRRKRPSTVLMSSSSEDEAGQGASRPAAPDEQQHHSDAGAAAVASATAAGETAETTPTKAAETADKPSSSCGPAAARASPGRPQTAASTPSADPARSGQSLASGGAKPAKKRMFSLKRLSSKEVKQQAEADRAREGNAGSGGGASSPPPPPPAPKQRTTLFSLKQAVVASPPSPPGGSAASGAGAGAGAVSVAVPPPPRRPPCAGLRNLGNTCYVNSVVQALRRCPGFVDAVAALAARDLHCQQASLQAPVPPAASVAAEASATVMVEDEPLSEDSPDSPDVVISAKSERGQGPNSGNNGNAAGGDPPASTEAPGSPPPPAAAAPATPTPKAQQAPGSLVLELHKMYSELRSSEASYEKPAEGRQPPAGPAAVRPRSFISALKRENAMFAGFMQHDAQELLRFLLHHLNEEEIQQQSASAGVQVPMETGGDDAQSTPQTAFRMEHAFEGKLRYSTRCLECEAASVRIERFLDLTLPVHPDGGRSLTWSLDAFAGTRERLDGDNKYKCSSCNALTEAERTVAFEALPPVLTIHLNRSSASGAGKVRCHVPAPMELRLTRWLSPGAESSPQPYLLQAVVFHSGHSASSGHYVCYARHSPLSERTTPSQWVLLDDSNTQFVSEQQLLDMLSPLSKSARTGYIFFYALSPGK